MADHQEIRRGLRISRLHRQRREALAGSADREMLGRSGAIPQSQIADSLRPGRCDAASRHPGSAAPVEQRAFRRRPAARLELGDYRVPFPADPLAKREVVAGQFAMGTPVIGAAASGLLVKLEKPIAQAPERIPVDVRPGEALQVGGVGFHKNSSMPPGGGSGLPWRAP